MYTITYENERGNIVSFGDKVELITFEGFGGADADIQLQRAPYQDGARFLDSVLKERPLYIEFLITGETVSEVAFFRRIISQTFNPKITGRLTVNVDGINYTMDVIPEHSPTFPGSKDKQGNLFQFGVIDLLSVGDSYWRSEQEIAKAIRAYQGKFTLPTTFPIEFGIEGESIILTNDGDAETSVVIDIQGPVTNPKIINRTTNQFIQFNRSLSADEVLHIDTNDLHKRVEVYRGAKTIENALGYIDHYSDFWKLQVGNNEIQYVADAGNADAIVAVSWKNRYVGI